MQIVLIICSVAIIAATVTSGAIMTTSYSSGNKAALDFVVSLVVAIVPTVLILKVATLGAFIVAGLMALATFIAVIAIGKKAAQNTGDKIIIAIAAIALAIIMIFSVTSMIHASDKTDEEVATVTNLEEEVSSYTDEQLLKMFGEPRKFKPTSTFVYLDERTKATGFHDAVTYNFQNGKDNWLSEELLSNPIFLMGADSALREIKLVGESEWSKTFLASTTTDKEWYSKWIEKRGNDWYVTKEYHLIACRYAIMLSSAEALGEKSDYTVIKHWPQKAELEKVVESTKADKFNFFVYKFTTKSGDVNYLGINVKDGRFAILNAPKAKSSTTVTPKKEKDPAKYDYQLIYDANGGKNPPATDKKTTTEKSYTFTVSKDKPTRSGYTFKGWSNTKTGKVDYKSGAEIKLTSDNPTKTIYAIWSYNGGGGGGGGGGSTTTYSKPEELIPDNQGNAPIGGTGTDGVDDQGPGTLQKNEPVHVDKDKDKTNDTREEVKVPADSKTTVDENKPNDKSVEIRHDTDYTDDKGKTHDIDNDPVNSGQVSGF